MRGKEADPHVFSMYGEGEWVQTKVTEPDPAA